MRLLILFAAVALVSCEVARTPTDPVLSTQAKPVEIACKHDCDHLFRSWTHSERARHRLMIKNCGGDPVCLEFERLQHEDILALLDAEHVRCLDNCDHQQGGGGGGQ